MAQSLFDIMSQIRGGYALTEAGKKLEELISAVRSTNKPGELTFTIKVAPDKVDDRIITLKPSIKAKIPERGFNEGIFFVGADGRLTKDDPKQQEMFEEKQRAGVTALAANETALSRVGRGD